jgi:hypothetical protein
VDLGSAVKHVSQSRAVTVLGWGNIMLMATPVPPWKQLGVRLRSGPYLRMTRKQCKWQYFQTCNELVEVFRIKYLKMFEEQKSCHRINVCEKRDYAKVSSLIFHFWVKLLYIVIHFLLVSYKFGWVLVWEKTMFCNTFLFSWNSIVMRLG